MSTTADETRLMTPGELRGERDGERPGGRFAWLVSLREALDKPLTSYYLLVGASALLLTIGL